MDDVADADYVVLGNWESQFFNDTWYDAQAYSKPTVMPKFVFETYERGILMDPGDYRTRGPGKPRRNRLRNTTPQPTTTTRRRRGRGKGGRAESVSSPSSGFSEGSPYWLRFFKDEERVWSLKYIGTLLKKDSKLTHQALAIYLSKQVSPPELVPHVYLTQKSRSVIKTHAQLMGQVLSLSQRCDRGPSRKGH